MADYSPAIANEFLRRARRHTPQRSLTQMQLQKLVYIAHGWNLAINDERLTADDPQAWDYGPVYSELRQALKEYGSRPVDRLIRNRDFFAGRLEDDVDAEALANLAPEEERVISRVFRDYAGFHAFKLSALTHEAGTPWTEVYDKGEGRFDRIPPDLIRRHFVGLARGTTRASA